MGRSGINENSIEFNFDDGKKDKNEGPNDRKYHPDTFGVKKASDKQVKSPVR